MADQKAPAPATAKISIVLLKAGVAPVGGLGGALSNRLGGKAVKRPPNCASGDTHATMPGMPTPVISMLVVIAHPVMMDPASATVLLAKAAWRAASSVAVRLPLALAGRQIPEAGRRNVMAATLGQGGVG